MCHQSLIFSLIPPLNPVVLCNICAEPLTMEMELDECICVDCAAEAALRPEPTPEQLGLQPLSPTEISA